MKHRNPIGIYEKALPYSLNWRERLALARECGFDYVEMSVDESDERLARLDGSASERAALREAIASASVPILTMCLSAHRKWALGSADPETRRRGLEILQKAIQFCADTGIRSIQLAGYYVYYEPHTPDSIVHYRDGLAQGVEWASQAGVMLALENVDGNDVDSISHAMPFVREFDSPWFQVYPDIGNLGEHGLDVCAELELGRGHIVGIHVKDTRPGEPRRVPFGEGIVPFVTAFRKLAEMGYSGPVMLEMWNDDSPEAACIVSDARRWVTARMVDAGLLRE
jgi:L-ribulose-5-phosphate 3-epimerase